jgi:hypothetical protein
MTKIPQIEGVSGAKVTVGKSVKTVRHTQVEVSEREDGHER